MRLCGVFIRRVAVWLPLAATLTVATRVSMWLVRRRRLRPVVGGRRAGPRAPLVPIVAVACHMAPVIMMNIVLAAVTAAVATEAIVLAAVVTAAVAMPAVAMPAVATPAVVMAAVVMAVVAMADTVVLAVITPPVSDSTTATGWPPGIAAATARRAKVRPRGGRRRRGGRPPPRRRIPLGF